MFLFTDMTPSSQAAPGAATAGASGAAVAGRAPVIDAIRQGAQASGTGFDYLVRTAQRESALDPSAKARTSSATGLFQFIEQTWLTLVRDQGAKHGLGEYARSIGTGADGRASVADPSLKQEILALRQDPQTAAALAGELAQRNGDALRQALGRPASEGELYLAHMLGAQGAVDLTRAAAADPATSAASLLPDAAAANRSVFYDRAGKARGAGEVYAFIASAQGAMPAAAPAASTAAPAERGQGLPSDGPPMLGLFRNDLRKGPVSEAVAKLWTANGRGGAPSAQYASLTALPSYFPRGDAAEASVEEAAGPAAPPMTEPVLVDAPLPPRRPASLSPPLAAGAGTPLNLSRFMTRNAS